jgi:hypothetical protein
MMNRRMSMVLKPFSTSKKKKLDYPIFGSKFSMARYFSCDDKNFCSLESLAGYIGSIYNDMKKPIFHFDINSEELKDIQYKILNRLYTFSPFKLYFFKSLEDMKTCNYTISYFIFDEKGST